MTKLSPLIPAVLLALPGQARAQEADRGPGPERPALRITARELLDAPPPVPRLGLAPLPSSLSVPIPRWSERADPRRWGLP
ncbi:MAG: hypothetical protein R3314_09535, partial [Longimicrobiales bacterium]|nr:hypothetical protein [Longimicrobiales bacterium]